MKLTYNIDAKPRELGFGHMIVYAFQQLLAIMAATITVPYVINNSFLEVDIGMSQAAALVGAGVGTLVYILFTKGKSPVFLGSSFAFIGSMVSAFAGATTVALGYLGLIIGAVLAGLVYVVIAIVVKLVGVNWISKLMPAAVIGPTVSIIGLSLAGNAVSDLTKQNTDFANTYLTLICGLITLAVTMLCSTYGKKTVKLIPFVIGVLSGYLFALILTIIGTAAGIDELLIINLEHFKALTANGVSLTTFVDLPDFTFVTAFGAFGELSGSYIGTLVAAYVPVAFVVFAEHIADHKNLSTIVNKDLLTDPGLSRTLLGDGIGSIAGAIFGGCPNTTYGESVGCVAITGNASVCTIITAAIGSILIAFISPFVAFVNSIPSCVMGGVCIALYGFIAVSGLKMIQKVDLEDNRNLFPVSVIFITGIGGLVVSFGKVTITNIACALILGILTNLMLSRKSKTDAQ